MGNNKDDNYYLEKMKIFFERIINTIADVSYDDFVDDIDKQDITMFNLIQISENAKMISLEYKDNNADIPWVDIYGLRNRIGHDYGNVVLGVVYQTITNDIPNLYAKLYEETNDDKR
ncbi:MAG: DUF86 domain-containing protein [Firmicutes bacterium]|nr:DUF86 domain-containing protein [Candidatus Colivicinus equi]